MALELFADRPLVPRTTSACVQQGSDDQQTGSQLDPSGREILGWKLDGGRESGGAWREAGTVTHPNDGRFMTWQSVA